MMRTACLLLVLALSLATLALAGEETLDYGRFGRVTLYRNTPRPTGVVLFVSGDGGWNLGVVDMARSLAGLDALVVGIDIVHYLKELERGGEHCGYPAADFENLSKYVQKKLGFASYTAPLLVGYSSGATLVYALLAQAPPGTFAGAISMGFCPDLPLVRPLCAGHGLKSVVLPKGRGYSFLPAARLENPWVAFQGTDDQVCSASDVAAFVKQVSRAEVVSLPKVGHGFSVQRNWLPQFRETFRRLAVTVPDPAPAAATAGAAATTVGDLPLVEVPAGGSSDLLAVILSGDGGWASLDKEIATVLAAGGTPVVGLNSLQYFWTARTPEQAGADLERILRHYLAAWRKERLLLIGYSFGADVLPFMAGRLPDDLKRQLAVVALIGPSRTAIFEFHLSDWLGGGERGAAVAPELERLRGVKVLCLYGEEETDSLCRDLPADRPGFRAVALGGGHHMGGDYTGLARLIKAEAVEKQER